MTPSASSPMESSTLPSASTSISSVPMPSSADVSLETEPQRRTRRRFTSSQLALLEHLYHTTTHPSREERESLAESMSLDLRAVTVWFQNKRQLERKSRADPWATDDASTSAALGNSNSTLRSSTRFNRTLSLGSAAFSSAPRKAALARTHSLSALSLDRVAARPHAPQTPPRRLSVLAPASPAPAAPSACAPSRGFAALLENLPPTPESAQRADATKGGAAAALTPEAARTFVEFGRRRRCTTLEWACAAARLAPGDAGDKEHGLTPPKVPSSPGPDAAMDDTEDDMLPVPVLPTPMRGMTEETDESDSMDQDETDDEHEAITPRGSLGGDVAWGVASAAAPASPPWKVPDHVAAVPDVKDAQARDEETMRAALALCGLGRDL